MIVRRIMRDCGLRVRLPDDLVLEYDRPLNKIILLKAGNVCWQMRVQKMSRKTLIRIGEEIIQQLPVVEVMEVANWAGILERLVKGK